MVTFPASDIRRAGSRRVTASKERLIIRTLHLVLSIPILGYRDAAGHSERPVALAQAKDQTVARPRAARPVGTS
jgi:hypothetical protein